MRARWRCTFAAASLLIGLLPTPAAGQAYVTAGKEIYSVTGSSSLVHTSTVIVGDLAVGHVIAGDPAVAADYLFFTEPALKRVGRINLGTATVKGVNLTYDFVDLTSALGTLDTLGEIRLTAQGDLLVGTTAGVLKIDLPSEAVQPITSTGSGGVGIPHDGSILFTDGLQLKHSPAPGFTPINLPSAAVSVSVANGGANPNSTDSSVAALESGDVLVSVGNELRRYSADGTVLRQTVTFGDPVQYLEIVSNHTVFVATTFSTVPVGNNVANHNGRFWMVDLDGTGSGPISTMIFEAKKLSGQWQPSIGSAVSASNRTITDDAAKIGVRDYKFGSHFFRITTVQSCKLSVEAQQTSKAEIESMLNQFPSIDPIGYLSEESWYIRYHVTNLTGVGSCGPGILVYTAAFFDGSPSQNFAMVYFSDQFPDAIITSGVFPFGGVPNDQAAMGETDNTSTFVPGVSSSATEPVTFCGLGSPLDNLPVITPHVIPQAAIDQAEANAKNLGQDLTFKFSLSTSGNCTAGPFISDVPDYPHSGALLSVMRVSVDQNGFAFDQVGFDIHPKGAANDPPLFRLSSGHTFNLDTTPSAGAPWTAGLYVITISSLDDLFLPVSFLVKVE